MVIHEDNDPILKPTTAKGNRNNDHETIGFHHRVAEYVINFHSGTCMWYLYIARRYLVHL